MDVLLEKEKGSVLRCPKKSYLAVVLKDNLEFESYQELFNALLEEVKSIHCNKIIYDLSKYKPSSFKNRLWYSTKFLPRCYRETNTSFDMNIVPPVDSIYRFGIDSTIKLADRMKYAYRASFFDTFKEAQIKWN